MGKLEKKKSYKLIMPLKITTEVKITPKFSFPLKITTKANHITRNWLVCILKKFYSRGNMLSLTILFLKLLMSMICITHFQLCAFLEVDFLPITKLNKLFKMYSHSIKPTLIHIRCRNKWWKVCYTLKAVC